MRVVLSGTSNSILAKGVSQGIATHPAVSAFDNVSRGASGVVAVGDHLSRIDFTAYDLCILDYHVNEAVLLYMGLATLEDAVSNLAAICDAASRAGCLPVITIFPLSNRFRHARPFEAAIQERLGKIGVPIFNLYPLIDRMAAETGQPHAAFFMDPNHVARDVGRIFGAGVVDVMAEALHAPPRMVETDQLYRKLQFVGLDGLDVRGRTEQVTRSTRLTTADLLILEPDAELALKRADDHLEIAGMTFNAARSWGHWIEEASSQKVLEPFSAPLFSLGRELALVSWPLVPEPKCNAQSTRLRYVAGDLTGPDRPPMAFEVAGLVLRDSKATAPLALRVPAQAASRPTEDWIIPEARHVEIRHAMETQFAEAEKT